MLKDKQTERALASWTSPLSWNFVLTGDPSAKTADLQSLILCPLTAQIRQTASEALSVGLPRNNAEERKRPLPREGALPPPRVPEPEVG